MAADGFVGMMEKGDHDNRGSIRYVKREREETQPGVVETASTRIFVANLPWETTWQELKDYFAKIGPVQYADVLREGGKEGRSKGCAIVDFVLSEDAMKAIRMSNRTELKISGRLIYCREDAKDYNARVQAGLANKRFRPNVGGYQSRIRDVYWGGVRPGNGGYYPGASERGMYQYAGMRGYRQSPPSKVPPSFADSWPDSCPSTVATIGRKVFVSNLSFSTSWQELKDHFKAAGNVQYVFIKWDDKGQSKGCGTVEFESPGEALRAISLLSNSTLGGRQIIVREDRADTTATSIASLSPKGDASGGSRARDVQVQVVVYGLPFSYEAVHLIDFMRSAGPIANAEIQKGPDGSSSGFGNVWFETPSGARRSIQMYDGRELHGRIVKVQLVDS